MTSGDNREAHSSAKIFGVKSLFVLFETKETGDAALKVVVSRT